MLILNFAPRIIATEERDQRINYFHMAASECQVKSEKNVSI